jgi:phage baseplate assembly protein W
MSFDLQLVNNDLKINADGTISIVTDTPKLRQDILKIILTPLGSNQNYLWYGCSIGDDVGRNFPDLLQLTRIQSNITQCLNNLKALQTSQAANQQVSLAELIDSIAAVNAQRDQADSRQLNVVVTVLSKRLSQINELFTIIS